MMLGNMNIADVKIGIRVKNPSGLEGTVLYINPDFKEHDRVGLVGIRFTSGTTFITYVYDPAWGPEQVINRLEVVSMPEEPYVLTDIDKAALDRQGIPYENPVA